MFLIVAACSFSWAQQADRYGKLKRRGTEIYDGRTRLTTEQKNDVLGNIEGVSRVDDWNRNTKMFKTGRGLLIGCGCLTGVGLMTTGVAAIYGMTYGVSQGIAVMLTLGTYTPDVIPECVNTTAFIGLGMTALGIAGLIAGSTTLCIAKGRMNTIVNDYNGQFRKGNAVSLDFGIQSSGIGLALNF